VYINESWEGEGLCILSNDWHTVSSHSTQSIHWLNHGDLLEENSLDWWNDIGNEKEMDRHIYNQQQINICMEQMFENGAIILGKIVEILGHQTKELV
jgi:hypothetical protein